MFSEAPVGAPSEAQAPPHPGGQESFRASCSWQTRVGGSALNCEEGSDGPGAQVTSALISALRLEARGLDVRRASLGPFVPVSSRSSRVY